MLCTSLDDVIKSRYSSFNSVCKQTFLNESTHLCYIDINTDPGNSNACSEMYDLQFVNLVCFEISAVET